MGVAGAATATVIARAVGALILIIYFLSGKTSFQFRPGHFVPDLRTLVEIYRVGVAAMVQAGAGSIVMIFVNRTAASFGTIPLATVGVIFRSFSFIVMPCMGIGQGILPLVGFNFGAGKLLRVGETVVKAGIACTIWGLAWWVVVMLFPGQLISVFNSDPEFLETGATAFRIFGMLLFAVGVQMSTTFFFQGIGKGLPAMLLASSRQVVFLLPLLFILPDAFGLNGLWASFPVADGLSTIVTLVWVGIYFRKLGIPFRLRYPREVSENVSQP